MINLQPKTAIEIRADAEQHYKFVGSIKLIKGLKLWQLNVKTLELSEVEITKKAAIRFDKKEVSAKKAQFNPDCIYVQALNRANAEKKIIKLVN